MIVLPTISVTQEHADHVRQRIESVAFSGNRSAFFRHLIDEDMKRAPAHIEIRIAEVEEQLANLKADKQAFDATAVDRASLEDVKRLAVETQLDTFYNTYRMKRNRNAPQSQIDGWATGNEEECRMIGYTVLDMLAYCMDRYDHEHDAAWPEPGTEPAEPAPCEGCGGVGGHSAGCPEAEGGGA